MPRLMVAAAFVLFALTQAHAAKRVALVIGNDNYVSVSGLQKAVSDANAIGATLEGIGYEVLVARDITRREMNRQLQLFVSRLEPGDEALFYFAGHGVEIDGRNYLLPTDIPSVSAGQEDFVKGEAIPVDIILEQIRSRGTRISILILDACRDNPFPKNGTRSLGGSRGLTRSIAPEGTFIMYSAGVGQTALDRLSDDDADPNSVFTRSLIPLLQQPGMSLIQTARQVRRDVQKLATTISHDQRPAYYDEITGDFFFSDRDQPAVAPITPQPSTSVAPQAESAVKDTTVRDLNAKAAEALEALPDDGLSSLARNLRASADISSAYRLMAEAQQRILMGQGCSVTGNGRLEVNKRSVDGFWGPDSRKGLQAYNSAIKKSDQCSPLLEIKTVGSRVVEADVSWISNVGTNLLSMKKCLRGNSAPVCGCSSDPIFERKGGMCRQKSCPAGTRLSRSTGNCIDANPILGKKFSKRSVSLEFTNTLNSGEYEFHLVVSDENSRLNVAEPFLYFVPDDDKASPPEQVIPRLDQLEGSFSVNSGILSKEYFRQGRICVGVVKSDRSGYEPSCFRVVK